MGARVFVWLGGALFVASLAFCAQSAVTWDAPCVDRPRRPFSGRLGRAAAAVDAVLLSLFALHHSLFARERVKRAMTRVVPDGHCAVGLRLDGERSADPRVRWSWRPIGGEFYDFPGVLALPLPAIQVDRTVDDGARVAARIDPLELAGIHPPREAAACRSTAVPLGPAPAVSGMGVDGVRRRAHDRRPAGVRRRSRRSISSSRFRSEERSLRRSFRRRLRPLHARRALADDPVHLLNFESSSSPPV